MRKLMLVGFLLLAGCGSDSQNAVAPKTLSGAERDAFISECKSESLKTANVNTLEALNYCTCTLDGILATFTVEEIEKMGAQTTAQKAIEMGIAGVCLDKHVDLSK